MKAQTQQQEKCNLNYNPNQKPQIMKDRIIKHKRKNNFTIVQNEPIKDVTMSWKSKGLLTFLLSLSDDFDINKSSLHKFAKDGRDATIGAFNELIDKGYIVSNKRLSKGKFDGYDYMVSDLPFTENPFTEKPFTENQVQLKKQETKETINKEKIIQKEILPFKKVTGIEGLVIASEEVTLFSKFWNKYKLKIDKKKCEKIFNKLPKANQLKAIDKIDSYFKHLAAEKAKGFNKDKMYPTTWLNGRFEDEYTNEDKPVIKLKVNKSNVPDWLEG